MKGGEAMQFATVQALPDRLELEEWVAPKDFPTFGVREGDVLILSHRDPTNLEIVVADDELFYYLEKSKRYKNGKWIDIYDPHLMPGVIPGRVYRADEKQIRGVVVGKIRGGM